eukprot:scaffold3747_cov240-Pinguiococcus_pyrenoidosus.AAC.18
MNAGRFEMVPESILRSPNGSQLSIGLLDEVDGLVHGHLEMLVQQVDELFEPSFAQRAPHFGSDLRLLAEVELLRVVVVGKTQQHRCLVAAPLQEDDAQKDADVAKLGEHLEIEVDAPTSARPISPILALRGPIQCIEMPLDVGGREQQRVKR